MFLCKLIGMTSREKEINEKGNNCKKKKSLRQQGMRTCGCVDAPARSSNSDNLSTKMGKKENYLAIDAARLVDSGAGE